MDRSNISNRVPDDITGLQDPYFFVDACHMFPKMLSSGHELSQNS